MASVVKIICYDCYDSHGAHYNQYDIVIDGVVDTGWCDSLDEAEHEAWKASGVSVFDIEVEDGGDLPQERY